MTRSLPQEQDSVAKFSMEADFKEMIMEGSQLCFSSQLATTFSYYESCAARPY